MKNLAVLLSLLVVGNQVIAKSPDDLQKEQQYTFEVHAGMSSLEALKAFRQAKEYAESSEGKNDKVIQAAFQDAQKEAINPEEVVEKKRKEFSEEAKKHCSQCANMEEFKVCLAVQEGKTFEKSKWAKLAAMIQIKQLQKQIEKAYQEIIKK